MTEKHLIEELERLRAENNSLKKEIMKKDLTEHSLLGFSQIKMIEKKIKMPGHYLFVLKKLMSMRGYSGMEKKVIDDKEFFWLKRGLLCEIFPIYIKTTRSHDEVLNKLVELGLIEKSQQYDKGGIKGSYSYVRLTSLCEEITNDHIAVTKNEKTFNYQLQKSVTDGSQKTVTEGSQKTVKQRPCIKTYPIQKETHYTYKGKISPEDIATVSNLLLVHEYTPMLKAQIIGDTGLVATITREREKDKKRVNQILAHCSSITTGKKVKGSLINYLNGKELPSLN